MRWLMIVGTLALVAGCGAGPGADNGCAGTTLFAASSFAPVVDDVADGDCLDEANVSLASSTVLAAQIADGAPVDVFVSAGFDAVRVLQLQGVTTDEPVTIGFNVGAVMVSTASTGTGSGTSLDLLTNRDLVLGACVESAPCGKLFDEVMSRVTDSPRSALVDTEVLNAADLVSKISLGEIDAGIVYRSDCAADTRPEGVSCIDIPMLTADGKPLNSRVPYVVVRLSSSEASGNMFRYLTGNEFVTGLQLRFGLEAP